MGKQRRKFETGFKQQIVSEVESGMLSVNAASRKYQLSASVIDRWRQQARQGDLEAKPSAREKTLERENRELKEKLSGVRASGFAYLILSRSPSVAPWCSIISK